MRRTWLVLLIPLVAAAPVATAQRRAPASVRVAECQPGADVSTRAAAFQADMEAVPGTQRMQVRFILLERLGNGRFRKVEAPGLGTWRSSRDGARRFRYTQRISGLKASAAYRVAVRHRWLDGGGHALRSARRRSAVCEVAGALPDLRVVRIAARSGGAPGTAAYSVVVRNTGGADARDVGVRLMVDGSPLPAVMLRSLISLETRSVRFSGPACTTAVSAVVDPDNALREEAEDDNVVSLPCPLGG